MPGVQADAVIVALEARTKAYEAAMEAAAKKTEAVFARIRNANKPVSVGANAGVEREAQAVEKASARKITAARKEAESEEQKAARISAMVDRSIAARERDARSAESTANRIKRAGDRSVSASQTAAMRGSTALGSSMAAPTSPIDKVNYLLRDQIDTQTRLNAAQAAGNKVEAQALRDQLTQFKLINQYKRAGLDETAATARAEQRVADIARRRANRVQSEAEKPGVGGAGLTLGGAARGIRNVAAIGFAGYGVAQGAREYLELTDAYKQYNAQLKLATAENGNLAQAQTDTQRIATETRTGLAETAQLYSTFQRNAAQLGLTQQESARATETVTKSFRISGATAAEASGGLRQFLQALQSGTLRGEEFNSVVENAPRLAKLLADQLSNGNIGALRALSQAGKITADDLKSALTNQQFTKQIDEEFRQLPVTFDQAMTVLKNAATVTFGEFDQGGQFSTALANFITGGSQGFVDLAKSASDTGIEVRSTFAGLSDAFAPLFAGAQSAFAGIRSEANYTRDAIANILGVIDELRNAPSKAVNAANNRFGAITGFQLSQGAVGPSTNANMRGDFLRGSRNSAAQLRQDRAARRLESLGYTVPRNADGSVNEAGIKGPTAQRSATYRPPAVARPAAAGGGKGTSQATLDKRAETARLKELRNNDAFESQKLRLDDLLLSAKGRQVQSIEEQAAQAMADADIDNQRRQQSYQADFNQKRLTEAGLTELKAKSDAVAAQQKLTAELDKQAAFARQRSDLDIQSKEFAISAKEAELNATTGRQARAKLEDEILELKYEEKRLQAEANLADAIRNKDKVAEQRARDDIALLPVQKAGEAAQNTENRKGPIQQYRDSLNDPQRDVEQAVADKLRAVDEGITDAVANQLGIKDPFLKKLLQTFLQQNVLKPIFDALSGASQSGGGAGGFFSSLLGSLGGLFGGKGTSASILGSAGFGSAPSVRGTLSGNDPFGLLNTLAGGRASGGNVSAGKLYQVNEGGIELFQPATSGRIVPTGRVNSSQGGVTIIAPQQFDLRGVVMTSDLVRQMDARNRQYADAVSARAGQAAYENSPRKSQRLNTLGT